MNGRIYDPLLGRFLSADIVVQVPDSLQSYNRYSYVLNNPVSLFDPSGFTAEDPHDNAQLNRYRELMQSDKAGDRLRAIGPGIMGSAIALKDSLFFVPNEMRDRGRAVRSEAFHALANPSFSYQTYADSLQYGFGFAFELAGAAGSNTVNAPGNAATIGSHVYGMTGWNGADAKIRADLVNTMARAEISLYFNQVLPALGDNLGSTLKAVASGDDMPYSVGMAFNGNSVSFDIVARGESSAATDIATGTVLGTLSGGYYAYKGLNGSLTSVNYAMAGAAVLNLTGNLVEMNGKFVDALREKLGDKYSVNEKDGAIVITWEIKEEDEEHD